MEENDKLYDISRLRAVSRTIGRFLEDPGDLQEAMLVLEIAKTAIDGCIPRRIVPGIVSVSSSDDIHDAARKIASDVARKIAEGVVRYAIESCVSSGRKFMEISPQGWFSATIDGKPAKIPYVVPDDMRMIAAKNENGWAAKFDIEGWIDCLSEFFQDEMEKIRDSHPGKTVSFQVPTDK